MQNVIKVMISFYTYTILYTIYIYIYIQAYISDDLY